MMLWNGDLRGGKGESWGGSLGGLVEGLECVLVVSHVSSIFIFSPREICERFGNFSGKEMGTERHMTSFIISMDLGIEKTEVKATASAEQTLKLESRTIRAQRSKFRHCPVPTEIRKD